MSETRPAVLLKDSTMAERLKAKLFYVHDGDLIFNFVDPHCTLETDPYLEDLIPAILDVIAGRDLP